MKAKPLFAVKFNKADIPISSGRAFGAHIAPVPRTSGTLSYIWSTCYRFLIYFFIFNNMQLYLFKELEILSESVIHALLYQVFHSVFIECTTRTDCIYTEIVEDVNLLIRRAERCLEAGADMIMIDADDVCKYVTSIRSDIIAKVIGRLGLEKTMFEASNPRTSEWFIQQYGPKVWLIITGTYVDTNNEY